MEKRIVIMLLLAAVMLNGCKPDSTAERPAADTMTTLDRVAQTEDSVTQTEDSEAVETAAENNAAEEATAGEAAGESSEQQKKSEEGVTVIGEFARLSAEEGNWKGLTTEEKLEDFDFLYQTLKENYPYWNLAERTQNIDLDEQYRITREKIAKSETDMQLFTNIQGFVGACGGIGHLQLLVENYADDYSNLDGIPEEYLPLMQKISEAYANDTSAAAYGKIEKLFQKAWEKVQAYYEEQGMSDLLQSGPDSMEQEGKAGGAILLDRGETDNLLYGIIEEGKTAYIKIRSFDMNYYEEDRKILTGLYEKYSDYENVIFDLTDNGGGGMSYFDDLIMAPNIDHTCSADTYQFVKNGSYNRKFMDFSEYKPVIEIPDLPRLNQEDLSGLDLFETDTYKVEPSREKKALKGKLWMLVNEYVYSSSEYAAMFTKATGFATLVGRTTGGDGIGSEPLPIVLKNSGLIVRYSPVYGTTPDGTGSEEFGTEPDILSPEGESPLETCLKAIDKYSITEYAGSRKGEEHYENFQRT